MDKYGIFALDFPNQEVQASFNKHLLMAFSGMKFKLTNTSIMQLRIALMEHKLDAN